MNIEACVCYVRKALYHIRERLVNIFVRLRMLHVRDKAVVWDDGEEASRRKECANAGVDEVEVGGRRASAFARCEAAPVCKDKDRWLDGAGLRRIVRVELEQASILWSNRKDSPLVLPCVYPCCHI